MPSSVLPLLKVAGSTLALYVFLVAMLRLLGRRVMGQLTVVDLVIIIALGSAVETAMIAGNTSLPAGLVSAGTLLAANGLMSAAAYRSKWFRHLLSGAPLLLVNGGRVVPEHLARAGLSEDDVVEGLRERGWDDLSQIRFAVLETDGSINVVPVHPHPGPPPGITHTSP